MAYRKVINGNNVFTQTFTTYSLTRLTTDSNPVLVLTLFGNENFTTYNIYIDTQRDNPQDAEDFLVFELDNALLGQTIFTMNIMQKGELLLSERKITSGFLNIMLLNRCRKYQCFNTGIFSCNATIFCYCLSESLENALLNSCTNDCICVVNIRKYAFSSGNKDASMESISFLVTISCQISSPEITSQYVFCFKIMFLIGIFPCSKLYTSDVDSLTM